MKTVETCATTKLLVALPCTAQELEAALHRVCDNGGHWDREVHLLLVKPQHVWCLEIDVLEGRQKLGKPETKGDAE